MRNQSKDRTKEADELWSLGVDPRKKNELNNNEELHELAENIKESMYQDYKLAYSEKGDKHKAEAESIVRI